MPARKNTAATPFNAESTQECWNLRSQLWQVREIVRKRAQKIELNKLVIQLWKHFPYRVIVNWVSAPLHLAGLWSPCGHTRVCVCVAVSMCANFSYICTRCAFLGELLCLALARAPVHSGGGAGKISCSSGSLIRIKWKHAVYIVPNNFSSFGFLWHLKWLLDKGFTKRLLQNLLQLRFLSSQDRHFFVATSQNN